MEELLVQFIDTQPTTQESFDPAYDAFGLRNFQSTCVVSGRYHVETTSW
jgi:hypothetical protein